MPVTLINPFTVPAGQEDDFLDAWRETAEAVKHAPGFIDAVLHRSLDPQAQFRFVNVAHWDSVEAWREAFAKVTPRESSSGIVAHPAMYDVAAAY